METQASTPQPQTQNQDQGATRHCGGKRHQRRRGFTFTLVVALVTGLAGSQRLTQAFADAAAVLSARSLQNACYAAIAGAAGIAAERHGWPAANAAKLAA